VPIGGQRYFVVAAILPALHVYFDFIEPAGVAGREPRPAVWLPLSVQSVFLFFVFLVRSSMGYLIAVLIVILLWRLWRERTRRDELTLLGCKAAIFGVAFALWTLFVLIALPAYVQSGRTLGIFWHRAFISFEMHPDWPFGNLREVYDCTRYLPKGLGRGQSDANGVCVWLAYPPNRNRSLDEMAAGLYNKEYEAALREAYFYVVTHYPRQTFELYVFSKSKYLGIVMAGTLKSFLAPAPRPLRLIVMAQGLLFIAFAVASAVVSRRVADHRLAIFPVFLVASLAPLYVAWAAMFTAADTICLFFCCLVLGFLLLGQLLAKAVAAGGPDRKSSHVDDAQPV
jgi:hypothetical protein